MVASGAGRPSAVEGPSAVDPGMDPFGRLVGHHVRTGVVALPGVEQDPGEEVGQAERALPRQQNGPCATVPRRRPERRSTVASAEDGRVHGTGLGGWAAGAIGRVSRRQAPDCPASC